MVERKNKTNLRKAQQFFGAVCEMLLIDWSAGEVTNGITMASPAPLDVLPLSSNKRQALFLHTLLVRQPHVKTAFILPILVVQFRLLLVFEAMMTKPY